MYRIATHCITLHSIATHCIALHHIMIAVLGPSVAHPESLPPFVWMLDQGTVVRGRRLPHPRRSPLPDPDGSSTSAASCVRYKKQSQVLRVVSIFLLNNIKTLYVCISKRRLVAYTVHRCALRGFTESLSHHNCRPQAFPKTESLGCSHAPSYIASSPACRARQPLLLPPLSMRLDACLCMTLMLKGQTHPSSFLTGSHEIGVRLSRSYLPPRAMWRSCNFPQFQPNGPMASLIHSHSSIR